MSPGLVPSRASPLGYQMAMYSLCLHVVFPLTLSVSESPFLISIPVILNLMNPRGGLHKHQTLLGQILLHGVSLHTRACTLWSGPILTTSQSEGKFHPQMPRLNCNKRAYIIHTKDSPGVPSSGDHGNCATHHH